MDYVDIYEIHRLDQTVPMEETLEALHDIVKSGKARYIAASNMVAWQFAKALYMQERHGWARFMAIQNQYNLVYREEEREMLPLCAAEGIGYTPYSPLARGFLAGKGVVGSRDTPRMTHDPVTLKFHSEAPDAAIRARVNELSSQMAISPAKVALAWVLRQPVVTAPVVGATKQKHVDDAVDALSVKLSDEDATYLEQPYQPRRVLLHIHGEPGQ
jgi:aryl-alcohol dehydrogenase (NADP+)